MPGFGNVEAAVDKKHSSPVAAFSIYEAIFFLTLVVGERDDGNGVQHALLFNLGCEFLQVTKVNTRVEIFFDENVSGQCDRCRSW